VDIDLNNLWLDVASITAKDWKCLDALTDQLVASGCFKGSDRKCFALAIAIFVSEGYLLREPDH
jgi:hypothetical protein